MTKKELKIINTKLDLIFLAMTNMPSFIAAPHQKQFNSNWKKAVVDHVKIIKQYQEIQNENNDNTPSFEDQVS